MSAKDNPGTRCNAPTGQSDAKNVQSSTPNGMTPQEFLNWIRPDNHLLTAIHPLRHGYVRTRHFSKADNPDIPRFIEAVQADGMGVYFSPGVPKTDADKKAKKSEIAATQIIYVDLDPPSDMDRESGRAALRQRLTDALPFYLPSPTLVDSGNGYQALFKLDELTTDLDIVEGVTRAVSAALGGDAGVWNVDRILRLPGTVNYPNQKKIDRGFTATQAKVVEMGQPAPLALLQSEFPPLSAPAVKAETFSNVDYAVSTSFAEY